DLLVSEPGVRLPDVQETLAFADREGVVRQDAAALAVSPFHRGHDHVERSQRALHLEPFHAASARSVRRPRVLHHESFVPAIARGGELTIQHRYELFARTRAARVPAEEPRRGERRRPKDSQTT